jgi:hypothetical protein
MAANDLCHCRGQVFGEGILGGRARDRDIRLQRERRKRLTGRLGAFAHGCHDPDRIGRHGNEIGAGQAVSELARVCAKAAKDLGRDQVVAGGGLDQPLGAVPFFPVTHVCQEALPLQLPDMIPYSLPWQAEFSCHFGSRPWVSELREDLEPRRVQECGGGAG